MHAAVIKAADVTTRDAKKNAADLDVGHLFGFDDSIAHVFLDERSVADFALAHAAGTRLAQADDVQGAFGVQFADHGADLGGADFQTDDDGGGIKHCFFGRVGV